MIGFARRKTLASDLCPLGSSQLFLGLGNKDLMTLESLLHSRHYLAGEVVFDQGEEGQALYVVRQGTVAIRTAGTADAPPIALLQAGDFFGEMSLLDRTVRSAQAVATSEATLSALYRGDFERLLEVNARLASRVSLQLARQLGSRLRGMLGRSETIALVD